MRSTTRFDLQERTISLSSRLLTAHLIVDKVAPLSIHAHSFVEINSALFSLILRVGLSIFAELVRAVGELALLLVRAKPKF